MIAGTIIAHNYLAYARVLAGSYARHHPEQRLCVLVIDAAGSAFDADAEPFETVSPEQLPLPPGEFRKMATIYDVMELATALKPFFLRFLLDRGADVAMFLDPDIEVFASLDELASRAAEHGIALTPHMLRSIPEDGRGPTQADIAISGVYNLGFIAVSAGARPFLEWWGSRLRRDCLVAPEEQVFVDQRLLDFLPGYRPVAIVRDPTCNVAYWNLHERRVTWTGAHYEVAGAPLRFFHFSGFNPTTPHLLSKHQGPHPRTLLSAEPALAQLCRQYAEHLLTAGHTKAVENPYGFAKTALGLPLDRRMRRLYRDGLLAAERGEVPPPPDPFDRAGAEAFLAWLNSPPAGSIGPTRYLRRLYDERADLRVAFPHVPGEDLPRFLGWVRADGSADPPIPEPLSGIAPSPEGPRTGDALPQTAGWLDTGVNVAGYLRAELGIGEGARLTLAALKAAGVPYTVTAYDETSSRQQHPFDEGGAQGPAYDISLVQVNADMFPRFAARYGRELLAGRYTVGIWAWELESFPPEMAASARYADEIWAVSQFAATAIAQRVAKPVFAFPHPVLPPTPPPLTRADLGLPDGFVFLFCFDFFSVMERKNPGGLVEAFCRAFAPNEGPLLVIKTINGDRNVDGLETLRAATAERSDIRIMDGYLPHARVHALMNACDAYVSLHRGEGFGLTLAECMALGKPVIATGYSGNLDFMTESNSYLVPFEISAIPPGCDPYPAGARWAEPDVREAARLMRHVFEHPDDAARVGQRARQDILELHSPEARAAFIRGRLSAIREARAAGRASPSPPPAVPAPQGFGAPSLPAAAELAAIDAPLGSRFGPIRFVQRVLLRILRPLQNHQRAILNKILAAMGELEREHHASATALARALEGQQEAARALEERHHAGLVDLERRGQDRLIDLERRGEERLAALAESGAQAVIAAREQATAQVHAADIRLDAVERVAADAAEEVRALRAELQASAHVWDPSLVAGLPDAAGRPRVGYHSAREGPAPNPYLRFEDIFRGPEAVIRDRQRVYLELLRSHGPIVEVGCGRGELLDLCREAGLPIVGVDRDAGMVERCRAKGHTVHCADALAYLARQGDGSIGAVISTQFVEHLPHDELLRFLQLAYRTLAADGLLVAETVNPHSIQAFKAFWTDPTHQRPLFPEVLLALCRLYGFEEASILFPAGTGDFQADRVSQGDYAVVAKRGAAARDDAATASGS